MGVPPTKRQHACIQCFSFSNTCHAPQRDTYPCCLLFQDERAEYAIVVISQPLNTASVEWTRSVNKKNMSVVAFHMFLLLLHGYLPRTPLYWTGMAIKEDPLVMTAISGRRTNKQGMCLLEL